MAKSEFIMTYEHCGQRWHVTHCSTVNDRCPVCNAEIEPAEIEDSPTRCTHADCVDEGELDFNLKLLLIVEPDEKAAVVEKIREFLEELEDDHEFTAKIEGE